MPRKMFAAIGHARLQQAMHEVLGQHRHDLGVAVKSAVANHTALAVVQVEHGGEAHVNTTSAQLSTQHKAASGGRMARLQGGGGGGRLARHGLHPHLAQSAHGRQMGETIGAKTLHPAPFVIDANQGVWADVFDVFAQSRELRTVDPIAGKQNQPARQGVGQAASVGGAQLGASDVQNQWGVDGVQTSSFLLFDDHKTDGVIGFITDADARHQAARVAPVFQDTMQNNVGLTAGVFGDFAQTPGHGHAHAQTHGFAERFLGRKTGGDIAHPALRPALRACAPGLHFGVRQNFGGKAFAMARQRLANAAHITYIRANAINHGLGFQRKQAK